MSVPQPPTPVEAAFESWLDSVDDQGEGSTGDQIALAFFAIFEAGYAAGEEASLGNDSVA